MQLNWHRRHLRARQTPALSTAFTAAKANESRVVPLFVLDDAILSRADGLGVAFMLSSLRALRDWYRDRGGDIVIRHGDPTDVVGHVAEAVDADRVVWNSDHSRLARGRDRAVRRDLTRIGVEYTAVGSNRQPETDTSIPSFRDAEASLADPTALGIETGAVPRLSDLGGSAYDPAPLTAGTASASKYLRALSNGTTYRRSDDTGTTDSPRDPVVGWV